MKRHLSTRQGSGILGHLPTWLVPATFLDENNNLIDSRNILIANGFRINHVAYDKRYYEVVPPDYWTRYPVDGTHEVYNDQNLCVFVQVVDMEKYFRKGQVYWKASENYAYETS